MLIPWETRYLLRQGLVDFSQTHCMQDFNMELSQRILGSTKIPRGFRIFCGLRVQENMETPDVHMHWHTRLNPKYILRTSLLPNCRFLPCIYGYALYMGGTNSHVSFAYTWELALKCGCEFYTATCGGAQVMV